MVTRVGGLPKPTLKTQGKETTATWSFKDDKGTRVVRLTFEPKPKQKRAGGDLFPRTISRMEHVDAFGKMKETTWGSRATR